MAGTKSDNGKTRWDLIPPELAFTLGERNILVDLLKWHHDRSEELPVIALQLKYKLEQAGYDPFNLLSKVLVMGAEKYEVNNWKKVEGLEWRYVAAACRHLHAADTGDFDEESGLPHDAHALCCVAFLLWLEARQTRPTTDVTVEVVHTHNPIVREGDPGYRSAEPVPPPCPHTNTRHFEGVNKCIECGELPR